MPMENYSKLRFRDLKVGDRFDLGTHALSLEEMLAFASKYDPQPFHLDDESARANPLFERTSASGWLSIMLLQKLIGDFWKATQVQGLAGAGVDRIEWAAPTYADEPLQCTMLLEMVRASASKPQLGLMTMCVTLTKEHQQLATLLRITGVFKND
ncbi:Acyl dehydratase [Pseudomonas sp. NFACC52]|nr:Acyl dehydratase [Pseudomonas sp. NFACC56-3]SFK87842.1 Acyl dehydratase [Pseudomonas sp. NFACC52]